MCRKLRLLGLELRERLGSILISPLLLKAVVPRCSPYASPYEVSGISAPTAPPPPTFGYLGLYKKCGKPIEPHSMLLPEMAPAERLIIFRVPGPTAGVQVRL